jgi:rRNA maturation RNase YbeY
LNEKNEPIEGDIYISIDRVKDNAKTLNIPFITELRRVLIHGVLHLCDYKDKSTKEEKQMREKENYYLNKI